MRASIGFFGFATIVNGHSWLHCTDYRGSVETYEPEKCFAHPRPKGGVFPNSGTFGVDRGFDTQSGVCQSTDFAESSAFPQGVFKRGQTVRLAWPSKNHVAASCTNPFIPDTSLELFVAPQSGSPTFTQLVQSSFGDDPHVNGKIDFKGFQNCPRFCDNTDKSLCTGTFTVPNLADGVYSFQWKWEFNAGTAPYVSCFEATIQGDCDGDCTPATTAPTTTQSGPTDSPVTTQQSACTNGFAGEWGQCGGLTHSGPTCCNAGLNCWQQNPYYHQCINGPCPSGWDCDTPTTAATTTTPATITTDATTTTGQAPVTQPTNPPGPITWEGEAATTRYWDCCKPSCSWSSNFAANNPVAPGYTPVETCTKDGSIGDFNAVNVCTGGGDTSKDIVYSCPDYQPFTDNNGVMYGFAAAGGPLSGCCSCYELEFTDRCLNGCSYQGQLQGRKMIVQVTNTGADLGAAHFDLQIPGGGFGIFNGCSAGEAGTNGPAQYDEPTANWGQRFGGVTSQVQCSGLPSELQAGCNWRFADFLNSDNPSVKYREVKCPAALTAISGCRLSNEVDTEPSTGGPSATTEAPTTTDAPTTTNPTTQAPTTTGCSEPTCAAAMAQCGGKSYSGPTECCDAGYMCYKQGRWYSQCRQDCPDNWNCAKSD